MHSEMKVGFGQLRERLHLMMVYKKTYIEDLPQYCSKIERFECLRLGFLEWNVHYSREYCSIKICKLVARITRTAKQPSTSSTGRSATKIDLDIVSRAK